MSLGRLRNDVMSRWSTKIQSNFRGLSANAALISPLPPQMSSADVSDTADPGSALIWLWIDASLTHLCIYTWKLQFRATTVWSVERFKIRGFLKGYSVTAVRNGQMLVRFISLGLGDGNNQSHFHSSKHHCLCACLQKKLRGAGGGGGSASCGSLIYDCSLVHLASCLSTWTFHRLPPL